MGLKKQSIVFMATILLAMGGNCLAAKQYPYKDITNIIPWSAGGGTDAAVRGFMHKAQESLGVKVFNKNITGAQSGVGTFKLINSRPDGYTIGSLTWDSVVTVPYYKLIPGYDIKKLSFIGTMTLHPSILVAPVDAPWNSIDDFVQDAKNNPATITVSNVGTGGVWHLPVLDFAKQADIELRYIPYPKGSATQREALLNGETDAACMSFTAAYPAISAGKVKVLGVMGDKRDPVMSDVPTFKESGYDVSWGSFRIITMPAKASSEKKAELEDLFGKAFSSPEFLTWADEAKMGAHWMGAEETASYISAIQTKAFGLLDELIADGTLKQ